MEQSLGLQPALEGALPSFWSEGLGPLRCSLAKTGLACGHSSLLHDCYFLFTASSALKSHLEGLLGFISGLLTEEQGYLWC